MTFADKAFRLLAGWFPPVGYLLEVEERDATADPDETPSPYEAQIAKEGTTIIAKPVVAAPVSIPVPFALIEKAAAEALPRLTASAEFNLVGGHVNKAVGANVLGKTIIASLRESVGGSEEALGAALYNLSNLVEDAGGKSTQSPINGRNDLLLVLTPGI